MDEISKITIHYSFNILFKEEILIQMLQFRHIDSFFDIIVIVDIRSK